MEHSDYYQVIKVTEKVFHFKMTGFWSDKIVDEIGEDFYQVFCDNVDSFKGRRFIILVDLSEFRTPSSSAKLKVGQAMQYGSDRGIFKAIEIYSSSLAKMGVNDVAKQHETNSSRIIVSSQVEAEKELEIQLKELNALMTS